MCIVKVKGMLLLWIVIVYILCNFFIFVIIFIGYDFGVFMGGVIVIECIFNINGIGNYVYWLIN